MGEQKNPRALDCRKRGRVTAAELLHMSLLLRRELDGILGQRSWHKDSPPDQTQDRRIVICQDLAHVKPATYLLRTAVQHLGQYAEWPKVAETVIKAEHPSYACASNGSNRCDTIKPD